MSEENNITALVRTIVNLLVDDPKDVIIEEKSGSRSTVISIIVPKTEIGKIVGTGGSVISAVRTISENIAAKNQKRVSVHIID